MLFRNPNSKRGRGEIGERGEREKSFFLILPGTPLPPANLPGWKKATAKHKCHAKQTHPMLTRLWFHASWCCVSLIRRRRRAYGWQRAAATQTDALTASRWFAEGPAGWAGQTGRNANRSSGSGERGKGEGLLELAAPLKRRRGARARWVSLAHRLCRRAHTHVHVAFKATFLHGTGEEAVLEILFIAIYL